MLLLYSRKEITKYKRASVIESINMAIHFVSAKGLCFILMVTYVLLGNIILAERLFKIVAWIEMSRLSLYRLMPLGIQHGTELYASLKRIQVVLFPFT